MKCPDSLIAALESRPGAKSLGIAVGHVVAPGKPARRPAVRKVGPNGENKLELDFEAKVLQPRLFAGEIFSYRFEARSFRLADPEFGKATYKPDWMAVDDAGLIVFEVKGHRWTAGIVRLKVFADRYRHIRVYLCRRVKGKWDIQRVGKGA
jgi:hypothetical protein